MCKTPRSPSARPLSSTSTGTDCAGVEDVSETLCKRRCGRCFAWLIGHSPQLSMIARAPDRCGMAWHPGGSMALECCKASTRRVREWYGFASDGWSLCCRFQQAGSAVVDFERTPGDGRERGSRPQRLHTEGRAYPQSVRSTLAWPVLPGAAQYSQGGMCSVACYASAVPMYLVPTNPWVIAHAVLPTSPLPPMGPLNAPAHLHSPPPFFQGKAPPHPPTTPGAQTKTGAARYYQFISRKRYFH